VTVAGSFNQPVAAPRQRSVIGIFLENFIDSRGEDAQKGAPTPPDHDGDD